VLIPGDVPRWETRASMPTPRVGATAVAVGGKIWVIGGVTARNVPSRAVEVYDPTRDAWEIRPPLREARAFAACGLIDGAIVVAGGTAGLLDFFMFGYSYMARPLQTVEVLRP
ncbi:MAG: kelch repeat-containing protein, partial [Candidatus Sericytochromatia bacterium]